jgi:hypothetical protein
MIVQVTDTAPWMHFVWLTLERIAMRSGARYPVDLELDVMVQDFKECPENHLWLVSYTADRPTGFMAVRVQRDPMGMKIAYVTHGWQAPGAADQTADALALAERWARERGCIAIYTTCERTSAAAAKDGSRFRPGNVWSRIKGLLAYDRWIGKRGYVMRETRWEKIL